MKQAYIIDTQFAHGTSLGSGDLKIYPKNFVWNRNIKDIGPYVFITESGFNSPLLDIIPVNRRIAFLIEPVTINPAGYTYVKVHADKFAYILSHDRVFNKGIPNATYYPFGGCWIEPGDRKVHAKTKLISIIASDKRQTVGHRLRHEIIDRFPGKIDVFGRGYKPIPNKIEALRDYCYSIVIENERSSGWFTEKLIDCLQTGTIPLYYGAPDMLEYFDGVKGFLNAEKLDDLFKHELENPGSMARNYRDMLPEVNKLFEASKKYVCPEDWIYEKYPQFFQN